MIFTLLYLFWVDSFGLVGLCFVFICFVLCLLLASRGALLRLVCITGLFAYLLVGLVGFVSDFGLRVGLFALINGVGFLVEAICCV